MPSPAKRRCLFDSRDANAELHGQRARNVKKLKSRFESIFDKYSRDFTGIGDIIDFKKDGIVVDNGHIRDWEHDKDPGYKHESHLADNNSLSNDTPGAARQGHAIPGSQEYESDDDDPLGMLEDAMVTNIQRVRKGVAISFPHNDRWIEPAWRVPLLPGDRSVRGALPSPSPSAEDDSKSSRSASPDGVSLWALPNRTSQATASGCLISRPTHSTSSKTSTPSTPWTQEEIQLLRQLKHSGKAWIEISNHLPSRTPAAIQAFWTRKRTHESPTRSRNIPSNRSLLPSPNEVRDTNSIFTNNSNQPLQTEEPDTLVASSYPGNPDAELEDDSGSESNRPSPYKSQKTTGHTNTVSPDSQGSKETQRVMELAPGSQREALSSQPWQENGQDNTFQSQVSPTGEVVNPLLVGSSSDTSPDVSDEHFKIYALSQRLQHMQALSYEMRRAVPRACGPPPVLTEDHCAQNNDPPQLMQWIIDAPLDQTPVSGAAKSMEHLVTDIEDSPCSGNFSGAPSAPLHNPVGCLITPAKTHILRELPDSGGNAIGNSLLFQATTVESGNEQIVHELGRANELSDVRSSLSPTIDPSSDQFTQAQNAVADNRRSRKETATTSHIFVRVEIPLLSKGIPEKHVVNKRTPKECFGGQVVDQGIRCAGHTTPPKVLLPAHEESLEKMKSSSSIVPIEHTTPPKAMLPAQEESLRKIKPFSLILPIEGSPTRHDPLRWTSPCLQPLDQAYTLGQGVMPSNAVVPWSDIPPATESARSARSTVIPPAVWTGDLEFASDGSSTDHSLETDVPSEGVAFQKQISAAEEDKDDLQLSVQPVLAVTFQNKRGQTHSGGKQRLALRPQIGSDDVSDDELSTPSKTVQIRVDETPVQAATARIRRLSSAV
ncbi:MAG: hypothetical protein Q9171_004878 [Xanthocarpia ochracea]